MEGTDGFRRSITVGLGRSLAIVVADGGRFGRAPKNDNIQYPLAWLSYGDFQRPG